MKKIFFVFLFHTILFSSSILDTKIYERDNRVDLLLSFDEEFTGDVSKHIKEKKTYIIITDVVAKNDNKFKLKVQSVDNQTCVKLRINFMGDKPYAEMFFKELDGEIFTVRYDKDGNLR